MPPKKILKRSIAVQCIHGDTETYPLAEVQLEVDGTQLQVEAAVSEKLPVAAILGEDVPQLRKLLQSTEEEKNGAGSMHEKCNLGEQEDMTDQERAMEESSQVNQETICDSLAMFRVQTEPTNKKTFEAEEELVVKGGCTSKQQKLIETEHSRDKQGRKKHEVQEGIDQATTT